MSALGWETASRPRHAELVSASMAGPLTLRCAEGNGRPWTLKQVQGDDDGNVAFRSLPADDAPLAFSAPHRSEEHTSELQSLMRISYAVFCLKKKTHSKLIQRHKRIS